MSLSKQLLEITQYSNIVCLLGLLISAYGLFVELSKDEDPLYQPFCDISHQISCSKAFQSPYGKGFGFVESALGKGHVLNQRNPIIALAFYAILLFVGNFKSPLLATLHLALVVFANIGSIYLSYVLYAKIKAWCVVCISLYVVNFLLLVLSAQRRHLIGKVAHKHAQKKHH